MSYTYMPLGARGVADTLKKLYKTRAGADFTIACGTDEHKVHTIVLSMQSNVLHSMATNDRFKEGHDAKLELHHDPPECVAAMVRYLYHLDYNASKDVPNLTFHVRMVVLADKYDIKHLSETAVRKFVNSASCAASDKNSNMKELAAAIDEAYEYYTATEPLRKAVRSVILEYPSLLAKGKEEDSPMRVTMLKHSGFAADVAETFATYKKADEDHVSNAEWFQHPACAPFKAWIDDDAEEVWWCPTCGAKVNGTVWQCHLL